MDHRLVEQLTHHPFIVLEAELLINSVVKTLQPIADMPQRSTATTLPRKSCLSQELWVFPGRGEDTRAQRRTTNTLTRYLMYERGEAAFHGTTF